MRHSNCITIPVIIVGVWLTGLISSAAQSNFQYAYSVVTPTSHILVKVTDEGLNSQPVEYFATTTDYLVPSVTIPSPDGQWIIILSGSYTLDVIELRLVNLQSSAIQTLTLPGIMHETLVWSPNSKRFVVADGDDLVVYATNPIDQRNLTEGDAGYYQYPAWSQDSAWLAAMYTLPNENSNDSGASEYKLHVFDVEQSQPIYELELPTLIASPVCDLSWSSNKRYLRDCL